MTLGMIHGSGPLRRHYRDKSTLNLEPKISPTIFFFHLFTFLVVNVIYDVSLLFDSLTTLFLSLSLPR